MQSFWDEEERRLQSIADKVIASGANVVFCQKGIDDLVSIILRRQAFGRTAGQEKRYETPRKGDWGKITDTLEDIAQLGYAGLVQERKVGDNEMIFVETPKPQSGIHFAPRQHRTRRR